MKKIQELLDAKGNGPVHHIGPDATVFDAVTRMVELKVGALLVTEGDDVKGIVTERDYLRFITAKGKTARDTPVREIMTAKVIYVTPQAEVNEVMGIMTSARIRHMPIMDDAGLCGIVSIGDVVKAITQDQQVKIKTLEEYIYDPYPGKGTA
jgi:CBS domain-containing protein